MSDETFEPTTPMKAHEPAATPTMEQMLGAATSPSGLHTITDPSGDPYETLRTAKELFDTRKYTEAARLIKGMTGTPEGASRDARELLARSYYHSAQLTKATVAARELLDVDPTNVDAAVLLVRSLERAGKKDEAAPVRRLARRRRGGARSASQRASSPPVWSSRVRAEPGDCAESDAPARRSS